jgi:putative membrane protein
LPRTLILAVDKDNDVGLSLGVEGPIVGYDELVKVAFGYAYEKPEDSDLNVLFAALKLYKEKKQENQDVEVALVTGDHHSELKADEKIASQLKKLKELLGYEEVILVSDGPEDESVIPIVLGLARVAGVKRVVVEQLRGVEETYILLGRYIKKAFTEPRFSRLFLGVPGIIILSLTILNFLGLMNYALLAIGIILGGAMVIQGFNLEEKIYTLWGSSPIMFTSSLFSTVFLIIALIIIYTSVNDKGLTPLGIGTAISSAAPFGGLAAMSILLGKGVVKILNRDIRIWRDIVGMVIVVIAIIAFQSLGESISSSMTSWKTAEFINAIVKSGFIEITLVGIGLSGIMTLIAMLIEKKFSSTSKE